MVENNVENNNKIKTCMVNGIAKHCHETDSLQFAAFTGCFVKGFNPETEIFNDLFQEVIVQLIEYGAKTMQKNKEYPILWENNQAVYSSISTSQKADNASN